MKYKIDTRESFDIITPLYAYFDSKLADQLNELVDDCRENGRGLLIDMAHVQQLEPEHVELLETLHHEMYDNNLSIVFCHLHLPCKQLIAEQGLEHTLNMAPTMEEAIDLISMEGLERELLGEE